MAKYVLSLPPSRWPEDLRARFERHTLTAAQRHRLRNALGRWFKISEDLGLDPRDISRETWIQRTSDQSKEVRNAIRQALAIVSPDAAAALHEGQHERVGRADAFARLQGAIAGNLARFPDDWREASTPLLHVDPTGLGHGILVQAWAPDTIIRRLQAAALQFDFCRQNDFPIDIAPVSLRAKLRIDQVRVQMGSRRIGGVSADLDAMTGLAIAVMPGRSWRWLRVTRDRVKKLANHHGSRNAARAVDAAELRAAGQQLLDKADAAHAASRHRRDFVKAHTKARTAVTMILLSEAPIRITGCAGIELGETLLADLGGLFLDAARTKEGDTDRRAFSATLIDALSRYIRLHRAVIAAPGETRLFVGERGRPILGAQLSSCLGRYTEPVFKVRVTPHAIRHSVGNFIVASAPEEAALASIILNHKSASVTPTYLQRAGQVVASRHLGAATEQYAAALAVEETSPGRRKRTKHRRFKLPGRTQRRSA